VLQGARGLLTIDASRTIHFLARGFIEPLAPNVQRVHAGYYVFDGAGAVSGNETSSRGGNIAREQTLQGKYTPRTDCAGTMTMTSQFDPKQQTHYAFFVSEHGIRANMIRTDAGSMAVRTLEK
jgi:hypothetical protein